MFDGYSWTSPFGVTIPLNRPYVKVKNTSGHNKMPPMRGSDVALTSRTGQKWLPKIHDSRHLTFDLIIYSPNGEDSAAIVQRTLDEFNTAFGTTWAQGILTHYLPSGLVVTAQATVLAFEPVDVSLIGVVWSCTLDLYLADPFFYSASKVTTTSIPASPTTASVVHPGTVRGSKILLDLLGPISNPEVLNPVNSVSVQCLVTVAAGTHLLIDCDAFTALNNGVNAIGSIVHSGAFEFMIFEPGTNPLAVTGTGMTGATQLATTFTPPYL